MKTLIYVLWTAGILLSAAEQIPYYSPEYRRMMDTGQIQSAIGSALARYQREKMNWETLINKVRSTDPVRSEILKLRKEIVDRLVVFISQNVSAPPEGIFFAAQGAVELNQLCDYFLAEAERSKVLAEVPLELDLRDFGGKGDGISDDAPAFHAAVQKIQNLRKTTTRPVRLKIPRGRYVLATRAPVDLRAECRDTLQKNAPVLHRSGKAWQGGCILLFNLDNVILDAEPGTLLLSAFDRESVLNISGCRNIIIRNISVDYSKLPFTQGDIVRTDSKQTVTMRVDNGYPAPTEDRFVNSPENLGMIIPNRSLANGKDVFFSRKAKRNADGTFDVRLESTVKTPNPAALAKKGEKLVLACRRTSAISFALSSFCDLINVNVYSAPGGGVLGWECSALTFQNLKVVPLPGSDRLLSSSSDATHTSQNMIGPAYVNCEISRSLDDMMNITTRRQIVRAVRENNREFLHTGLLRPGHRIQLIDPTNGTIRAEQISLAFDLAVKWNSKLGGGQTTLAAPFPHMTSQHMLGQNQLTHREQYAFFTGKKLPPSSPDWVFDADNTGSGTIVYRCYVHQVRGSMRVQCANGLIAENRCVDLYRSGVGISMLPGWGEIVPSHNILVRNNEFIRTHHGIAVHGQKNSRVMRNFEFNGNRIEDSREAAVYISEASDILFRNNVISSPALKFGICLGNVENIRFENNKLNFPKASPANLYHTTMETGTVLVDGQKYRNGK